MSEIAGFKVLKNEKVGRFAVASRNLKQGEVIFSEKPFAVGPKPDTPPLCLSCYNLVDGSYFCSKCAWPLCNAQCEVTGDHSRNECSIFQDSGVKFQGVTDWTEPCPQYDCITPLRVLLAKERDGERWEKEVSVMESHDAIRREKPAWNLNQINVVEFLRGPSKLQNRFSQDLIHKVCGILEVNTFEVRSANGYAIRGLYPQLAVFSHNCVANTAHSFDLNEGNLAKMRVAVDVRENQELFSSYTYSLAPTLIRREHLLESKFFECDCGRCKDPTELGTHLSTLKCTKCDNGWIQSTDPLNADAEWHCTLCAFATRGQAVRKVFYTIQRDLDAAEDDLQCIESREQLFRKYKSVLHPRNAYLTNLKHSLSQLYGRVEGYTLDQLPDILLERKIELCKQLLDVFDVIEPGCTRMRGMILYEMHAPILLLARSLCNQGAIAKAELKTRLEEALRVLEESANILTLEPSATAEGIIGQVAQQSLVQLKENINALVETA